MNNTTYEMLGEFRKERDTALFSLDEEKIRAFLKKWNPEALEEVSKKDPRVFWIGIYKAILSIRSCPDDVKKEAVNRLNAIRQDMYYEEVFGR